MKKEVAQIDVDNLEIIRNGVTTIIKENDKVYIKYGSYKVQEFIPNIEFNCSEL
jgi:hypothetical protein